MKNVSQPSSWRAVRYSIRRSNVRFEVRTRSIGRISDSIERIGLIFSVEPILSIESEILPIERVRTSGRAFERLIEYLEARHEDGCDTFFIQHVHAPGQAERLVERGRDIYGREPELVSEIGPVIGAHVGPGLLGVSGMRRELLYPRG